MIPSVGWRSTTLGLVSDHCPRALDFYENGVPYDRTIFARGVAAHAVLEDLGHETRRRKAGYLLGADAEAVAHETCLRLIRDGRDFEGQSEPPLPEREVFEGRDMALSFHEEHPSRPDFEYEIGLAVNARWEACPYDTGAALRCRIDATGTRLPTWADDEDGGGGPRLVVDDYKSGWQDDARALHSIQRKIQGVLAWDRWGKGHEILELRVVNFRSHQIHSLELYPNDPEDAAKLKRWRRDIEAVIAALDAPRSPGGLRPAAPGPRCFGCPYVGQCGAARDFLGAVWGAADRESLARVYGVAEAVLEHADGPLREACSEALVEVDGCTVGYHLTEERSLRRDAAEKIVARFLERAKPASQEHLQAMLPGLLRELKLGVAQAKACTKYLFEGSGPEIRERRERFLSGLVEKSMVRKFRIVREKVE